MINKYVYAVGVMSGTSLDGLDLVYVKFETQTPSNFQIIHAQTTPYSKECMLLLKNAIHSSPEEIKKLDLSYGAYIGTQINHFIANYGITKVDFIASHGHTVLHQPEKGITVQVGCGVEIAKQTSIKVVYDFRTQDVQLGGQGAPLVPIGDHVLFQDYEYCLNLGGFSNISFVANNQRVAFDICPVNIVLNHYANTLGLPYDSEGKLASSGTINYALLEALNALDFYQKNPPKSLGLEWVQAFVFPLIDAYEKDVATVLRTFVEHIAIQIGKVIFKSDAVLVTGGGAFNTFLLERIEFFAKNTIPLVSDELINFKEALVFSFLGLLKINGEINCLKSVTGAQKNHSSGSIVSP